MKFLRYYSANRNYNGKIFEEKTCNINRLLVDNFTKSVSKINSSSKFNFYLSKKTIDKTIVYTSQYGLKNYMKNKYNIELFRYPDEAYIIYNSTKKKTIKILEKKEQSVNGSVETKLWSSPSLKREYSIVLGNNFEVEYALCINEFLQEKINSKEQKYKILNKILSENNIQILFGDNKNYFKTLDRWINN